MRLFLRPIAARLLKCPPFFGIVILMTFSSAQVMRIVQSRIIYSIVYGWELEITWKHRDKFHDVILRLGVFHAIGTLLAIIGKRFQDAGLEHLDKDELSNYRPISNLSLLSKIIERVVKTRLTDHLTSSNLLNPHQSAYCKHHSTETALYRSPY